MTELIKKYTIKERSIITPIKVCADLKRDLLPCFDAGKEFFIVLHLDSANKVICREIVHIGGLNTTIIDTKCIFRNTISLCANSIILAHNHPSGGLEPSKEDLATTKKLKKAGDLLGIKVLDHVIFNETEVKSIEVTK